MEICAHAVHNDFDLAGLDVDVLVQVVNVDYYVLPPVEFFEASLVMLSKRVVRPHLKVLWKLLRLLVPLGHLLLCFLSMRSSPPAALPRFVERDFHEIHGMVTRHPPCCSAAKGKVVAMWSVGSAIEHVANRLTDVMFAVGGVGDDVDVHIHLALVLDYLHVYIYNSRLP